MKKPAKLIKKEKKGNTTKMEVEFDKNFIEEKNNIMNIEIEKEIENLCLTCRKYNECNKQNENKDNNCKDYE